MYLVSTFGADFVVAAASEEAKRLEKLAASKEMRGPEHAAHRKALRLRASDLHCVVAGINTGEGVTRASAVQR